MSMFGGMRAAGRVAAKVKGLLDEGGLSEREREIIARHAAKAQAEKAPPRGLLDEAPIAASQGGPADSISLVGYHYGNAPNLRELMGRMYGTGAKGKESERLAYSRDPRIRDRVYFYGDRGDGMIPRPEPVVMGPHVYRTTASGLYVPGRSDPGPVRAARAGGVFDANQYEANLLDAGYMGYFNPDYNQIVLLGRDRVPVEYLGTRLDLGPRIRKAP